MLTTYLDKSRFWQKRAEMERHFQAEAYRAITAGNSVFMEAFCPDITGQARNVYFHITEPTIVAAFEAHFDDLWEKVSEKNRTKEYVVWWLEQRLAEILNDRVH